DEPTSVLTPQEAEILFDALHGLSAKGCALLYITHRLAEVSALCERATVLRRGRLVGHCDPRETPPEAIAEMMVGGTIAPLQPRAEPDGEGAVRLRVRSLTLSEAQTGGRALTDVYLQVRAYEVLGIAGIAGEGQNELTAALAGEVTLPLAKGAIEINNRRAAHRGPADRRRLGAAVVPEDRTHHATVGSFPLSDNVMLTHHGEPRMARSEGLLRFGLARAWVDRIREAFDVRGAEGDPQAARLSGGNLQKFIVGREVLRTTKLLVLNQPTWGVDAQAAARIRQAILDAAEGGAGVVVISQDLDELFQICDRIAVMHRGKLTPARPVDRLTPALVGLMMAGEKVQVHVDDDPPRPRAVPNLGFGDSPDDPVQDDPAHDVAYRQARRDDADPGTQSPREGPATGPAEPPVDTAVGTAVDTPAETPAETPVGGRAREQAAGGGQP
ncbi:MAG: ATP-binding cassette domain-containing protein, partial [Pseudomonadota bacterium]